MSRHGVIGNSSLLALYDEYGYVRDLYYPYAGSENHVVSAKHRVAFKINDKTYLLEDLKCKALQSYKTLKYQITTKTPENINIKIENIIYNEKNILLKKVTVKNPTNEKINFKAFFNQEYKIKENKYRNTGYYYPLKNCVIHYQGNRVFLSAIVSKKGGLDDYTIGLFDFEGKAGSYLSIYNDTLPKNPIEHGPVDSVIAKSFGIEAKSKITFYYCLVASTSINKAISKYSKLEKITPQHIYKTTINYWKAWKKQSNTNFFNLPRIVVKNYYKSLFVIKTHSDRRSGGILASGDSEFYINGKDNYAYVWARDAYYPAKSLVMAGFTSTNLKLFDFFSKTITKKGYINQKFEQNLSLGSCWHPYINKDNSFKLPIQQDETAAVINSVYNQFDYTKNVEFLEKYFNNLVRNPANFLCAYKINSLNLPKPSYDIWEAQYIISTYTVCSVIKALNNAYKLSKILNKNDLAKKYKEGSEAFKKGLIDNLYNKNIESFVKGIEVDTKFNITNYDVTKDSSTTMALWYFDVFDPLDNLVVNTLKYHKYLVVKDHLVKRFENDDYFRKNNEEENAWIISSLWNIHYLIRIAKNNNDLDYVVQLLNNISLLFTKSGILTEQINIKTGLPESYGPLIWSNATYIETVIEYTHKYEQINPIR